MIASYFKIREGCKQNMESMSMLIPKGGGGGPRWASAHTSLGFFSSSCSKPICLAQGSPKTDFVFTPNTIFHLVSHLCDHLDQASHLKFVEFVVPLFCLVLLKFNPKSYKIGFTAYLTSQIIQKRRRKIIT